MSRALSKRDSVLPTAPRGRTERRRDEVREFLEFSLGADRFALPLRAVREILKLVPITEVPRARPHVLGILSVRGRITTVIDLRKRLRLPAVEGSKSSRILLVDGGDEVIGLLVDEVHQVQRLRDEEIEAAGAVAGELSEHVIGIGRPAGGTGPEAEIVVLLDPEPLLRR